MSTHRVHVFISHSWSYSGHYETLASWIFDEKQSYGQASIEFHDYSVPRSHPIHNMSSDAELRSAIYNQIMRSHVIVIPMGMYTHYSKWIRKEIDGASIYGKPILGVNPWGQLRTSSVVVQAAAKTVGWNRGPVVNAIWDLYYRRS